MRVSHRANRVILKVSGRNGLEVIVPRGFNIKRLPRILAAHEAWITNQVEMVGQAPALTRPEFIDLSAVGQHWQVEYRTGSDVRFSILEESSDVLQVQGDAADDQGIAIALNRWLHTKGAHSPGPLAERS